jgi:hypothetical protein
MDYLNIPVAFCVYILKTHHIKQFQLFIYLKTICSGHFQLTDALIEQIRTDLNYRSVKTFQSYFQFLLQQKWITYNGSTENYRLIGFERIADRMRVPTSKGVIYYPEFLNCFKGFITGAVVTYYMIYRSQNERRPALKKRGARKSRLSASFSLPHNYLAKVLKVSKITAQRYRQYAIESGFIEVSKSYIKTILPLTDIENFKKYSGNEPSKVRKINNTVCLQEADKLKSNLILRRKKNIRFVNRKFGKKWYR